MSGRVSVASLEENIAAFEERRGEMVNEHLGQWVIFHNRQFIGAYVDVDTAVKENSEIIEGAEPCLIRKVREEPLRVPHYMAQRDR